MKFVIVVCFLLGLSASVVLASDLDVEAQDEAAVGPALTRVRREGSDSDSDHDSDDDDDDEECCQNSCDEDYFYELVLNFADGNADKNLNLGRVVLNEKDCGADKDKSESDRSRSDESKCDRSRSCRKHHRHHRSSRSRSDSDCSD